MAGAPFLILQPPTSFDVASMNHEEHRKLSNLINERLAEIRSMTQAISEIGAQSQFQSVAEAIRAATQLQPDVQSAISRIAESTRSIRPIENEQQQALRHFTDALNAHRLATPDLSSFIRALAQLSDHPLAALHAPDFPDSLRNVSGAVSNAPQAVTVEATVNPEAHALILAVLSSLSTDDLSTIWRFLMDIVAIVALAYTIQSGSASEQRELKALENDERIIDGIEEIQNEINDVRENAEASDETTSHMRDSLSAVFDLSEHILLELQRRDEATQMNEDDAD